MTERTVRPPLEDRFEYGSLAPAAPSVRPLVIALGVLLLPAIALAQPQLAPDSAISLLYLVPVVTLAWVGGRVLGASTAVAAAGLRFLVDLLAGIPHSSTGVVYWNLCVSLAVYATVADLLPRLRSALDRERERARRDPLTGLGNRRFFEDVAGVELNRTRRYARPLALGYVDVDHFKEVNDRMGHDRGDQLLRLIARELVRILRTSDVIGRIGGDEFAVLLPETPPEGADVAFRKMHEHLSEAVQREGYPVSFSVGVVTYTGGPVALEELLREADATMYAVKNGGKGYVQVQAHAATVPALREDVVSGTGQS